MHYPFHHAGALEKVYDFCKKNRIETLHLLGDIFDCTSFSKHRKYPQDISQTAQTLETGKSWLSGLLGRIQPKEAFFYAGNHERRIHKFVLDVAPQLFGVIGINILLEPNKKISLVDSRGGREIFHNGMRIRLYHGDIVRKNPGESARVALQPFGSGVICGHTHRLALGMDYGRLFGESGHLSDYEKLDYLDIPPNWQHGGIFFPQDGGPQLLIL